MRKANYYRPLAILLPITLAIAGAAQAASLHFIVLADTLDPSIGSARDLLECNTWAGTIASHTRLNLELQTLSGQGLTPDAARRLLNRLSPASDDVVFFIYTGHGANPGNSQWPLFGFLSDSNDPLLTFDEVVSILQLKQQRMLVVMADCCNVAWDAARTLGPIEPSGRPATTSGNFQRLFLDFRGTVLATSSKAGQYSLGNQSDGGLFLNTFMNDLSSLASGTPDLTWDMLLSTTASDVTEEAAGYFSAAGASGVSQEPYYTINVEQVAATTPNPPGTGGTPGSSTETSADGISDTPPPSVGCGAVGATFIAMTMMGCFALKARRILTSCT